MAEVYIDSLTLENFGPFYGEHTLDFRSLEGKCGILVGGKNGAGKTHLLRALYLAVVGESGVGDLRKVEPGSDATRPAFEKSLNRHALAEGQDTMRLKAVISLRDAKVGSRKVELLREVRFRSNSAPVWEHSATRSDSPGRIEDEQVIQKLRDAFLPRHLARFFFFDAERSQSINLGQQDIVEGVSRILGLWTYTELENDLRQLISTKIPRVFNSTSGPDPETILAELNGKVITADGILKARHREHSILERDLRDAEGELLEIEDDLKTLGAVDPDELLKAQERRTELTEAKAKLESKLTAAWELAMPVSLLGIYRKELHDALQGEERRREWESAKSTVEPKIPQVKKDVFENAPKEFKLQSDLEAFYMKRLEDALAKLFNPAPEGMPDNIYLTGRNDVSAQVRSRLATNQREIQDLSELCVSIEQMDVELRELDGKLKQMQQNTAAYKRGVELHEKRGGLISERDRITKRLKDIAVEIARLEVEVTDLKRQETIQREIVERAERGESLAAMATRYHPEKWLTSSLVIDFKDFGNDSDTKALAAALILNFLMKKLNQQVAVKNGIQPLKMVLFVDEAHLLLPKEGKAGLLGALARQGRSWGFPVWLASQDADKFLTSGTNETNFAELAECGVHFSPQTLSPADQKQILGGVIHQKFKKAEAALRLGGKLQTGMTRQFLEGWRQVI